MFMTAAEKSLIMRDFNAILDGPEGVRIVAKYMTNSSTPTYHPVYKHRTDDPDPSIVEVTIKSIQKYITLKDKKLLEYGHVEVGDCIFYIKRSVDLTQLETGKTVVEGTLYFVDPESSEWEPIFEEQNDRKRFSVHMLGQQMVQQAVPCRIKKA